MHNFVSLSTLIYYLKNSPVKKFPATKSISVRSIVKALIIEMCSIAESYEALQKSLMLKTLHTLSEMICLPGKWYLGTTAVTYCGQFYED